MPTIAGAGMAGLVAAARARELGADPVVLEKGTRAGGSMLLSSGVVWRFRSLDLFREECPGGEPELQQLIVERLDAALDWLEALGAPLVGRETGNPRTVGRRFEPRGLTETLARAAGDVRISTQLPEDAEPPVVLATGGFPVRLARELGLPLRSNPWSEGDGLEFARRRGAALSTGMDEFYGRAMPDAPFGEDDFVRLSQLYGRFATVLDERGDPVFEGEVSWSENDLVQAIAQADGTAWYVVDRGALSERVRERTVGEMIEAARAAGGTVRLDEASVRVRVRAAVTHTIGGLRIDTRARVLDERSEPIPGLYAAGVDAGGWSTGGYASGLAAALVFGMIAAETAVEERGT